MGGVELFGRGPVMLGVLRTYGGGGITYGAPIGVDATPAVGGGGHYGVEVIAAPRMSFTFEVGGQAPLAASEVDGGAHVMAGATFYLGRKDRE